MREINQLKIRIFLILLMTTCLGLSVEAGEPLKVISGDASVLKSKCTAVLACNYDKATWEETETLEHHFKDEYNGLTSSATRALIRSINENSTGVKIIDDESAAQYKIVFDFDNFRAVVGSFYRKYVWVSGVIKVIDIKSTKTICVIDIKKSKGANDYATAEAFSNCLTRLGRRLVELK